MSKPAVNTALNTLTVKVRTDIVRDLKRMEENTRQSVDDLVTKALLMFIATHKDYLGNDKLD